MAYNDLMSHSLSFSIVSDEFTFLTASDSNRPLFTLICLLTKIYLCLCLHLNLQVSNIQYIQVYRSIVISYNNASIIKSQVSKCRRRGSTFFSSVHLTSETVLLSTQRKCRCLRIERKKDKIGLNAEKFDRYKQQTVTLPYVTTLPV